MNTEQNKSFFALVDYLTQSWIDMIRAGDYWIKKDHKLY